MLLGVGAGRIVWVSEWMASTAGIGSTARLAVSTAVSLAVADDG
ncbi:hypothetical protein [Mycobacterium leprae]|nr:hypothetical protein [Mycobacterium leprae]